MEAERRQSGSFLAREIRPRLSRILRHRNAIIALGSMVISVILSSFRSPLAPKARATITDITATAVAISGFGFALSVAALALVLALPQSRMLRNMMLNAPGRPGIASAGPRDGAIHLKSGNLSKEEILGNLQDGRLSAFSNLVFVFTWTGVAQIVAVITAFVSQIGAGASVVMTKDDLPGMIAGAAIIGTTIYALLQLLTCVTTVARIAAQQERYFIADVKAQEIGHD